MQGRGTRNEGGQCGPSSAGYGQQAACCHHRQTWVEKFMGGGNEMYSERLLQGGCRVAKPKQGCQPVKPHASGISSASGENGLPLAGLPPRAPHAAS